MDLTAPPFALAVDHHLSVTTVALTGELDLATAPELRAAMADLIDRGHTRMVLDVRGIRFCDSSGLSAILGVHQRLRAVGGCLQVEEPCPTMRKVLAITATDRILHITP